MIYVNSSKKDSWSENIFKFKANACKYKYHRSTKRVQSQLTVDPKHTQSHPWPSHNLIEWPFPQILLWSLQPWNLSPPNNWGLITDDLSLIEWVCSCTINLKEQWIIKGYIRTKQLCSGQGVSIQCDTNLEAHSRSKKKHKILRVWKL